MTLEDAQKNQAIGEKLYLSAFYVKHKASFHAGFSPNRVFSCDHAGVDRTLLRHRVPHGTSHSQTLPDRDFQQPDPVNCRVRFLYFT